MSGFRVQSPERERKREREGGGEGRRDRGREGERERANERERVLCGFGFVWNLHSGYWIRFSGAGFRAQGLGLKFEVWRVGCRV